MNYTVKFVDDYRQEIKAPEDLYLSNRTGDLNVGDHIRGKKNEYMVEKKLLDSSKGSTTGPKWEITVRIIL